MKRISFLLLPVGLALISLSVLIFILTFFPIAREEINYRFNTQKKIFEPIDKDFGIMIPKIGANAKVIEGVDPFNKSEYQRALTKGVAQAKGTAFPGEQGNIFLFSHSSANFYEANKYNSVFFLLNELDKDDEIYLFFKGEKYKYRVLEKKVVDSLDTSYLNKNSDNKKLTLMTCWPPGTSLKRLIVIASL